MSELIQHNILVQDSAQLDLYWRAAGGLTIGMEIFYGGDEETVRAAGVAHATAAEREGSAGFASMESDLLGSPVRSVPSYREAWRATAENLVRSGGALIRVSGDAETFYSALAALRERAQELGNAQAAE